MKKIIPVILLLLLFISCENIFQPFSDDSQLSAQGRLERCKLHLSQKQYTEASNDVAGALSKDSTLSEAYYLKAKVGLWQYGVDMSNMENAITVGGRVDSTDTLMPFTGLSIARKDSIIKGNAISFSALEVIKAGKPSLHSTKQLDSVFQFKDLWLDYVTTYTAMGMISLFDIDTNMVIDSLDSAGINPITYCFNDSLYIAPDTLHQNQLDTIADAAGKSMLYFQKASLYADSLLLPFSTETESDAYIFRGKIGKTIKAFIKKLPDYM